MICAVFCMVVCSRGGKIVAVKRHTFVQSNQSGMTKANFKTEVKLISNVKPYSPRTTTQLLVVYMATGSLGKFLFGLDACIKSIASDHSKKDQSSYSSMHTEDGCITSGFGG